MQGQIDCRTNTFHPYEDYRVDFDPGEVIPSDQEIIAAVLRLADPGAVHAEIVARAERHMSVRVHFAPLAIVPASAE